MLALQLAAGVVVVLAYAGVQCGRVDPYGLPHLLANVASTGLLAAVALAEAQYGFVMTNGVWAAVSTLGLVRCRRAAGSRTGVPAPGQG